ncbi:MAG: hypothetical protein HRT38_02805 [Alteromonadaceae bacterium]|nr:hypothetical protein [Alteromonadaceae bacterium]
MSDKIRPGEIGLYRDPIEEKLAELADLAQLWRKHDDLGRIPSAIRVGMLSAVRDIQTLMDAFINEDNEKYAEALEESAGFKAAK